MTLRRSLFRNRSLKEWCRKLRAEIVVVFSASILAVAQVELELASNADANLGKSNGDSENTPPGDPNPVDQPFKEQPPEQESGWTGGLLDPSSGVQAGEDALPDLGRNTGFRLRLGILEVRPIFQFGSMYDDNLLLSHTRPLRDWVTSVTVGLAAGIGDYIERKENYLSFGYTPNYVFYRSHRNMNALNQAALFGGQIVFNRLTIASTLQWETLESTDRDAGGRTIQDSIMAELKANYALSETFNFEMKNSVISRDNHALLKSIEKINRNWIVYKLTEKLDFSGGATLGQIEPNNSASITYQQLLLRSRLESTEKLSFNASSGIEFRQFSSGAAPLVTPVFDLGGKWQPFHRTELSVSTYRRLANSSAGQSHNYTTTGFSGSLRQQFARNLSLEMSTGAEKSDYFTTAVNAPKTALDHRSDDYVFGKAMLALTIDTQTSLSLYYLTRNNTSSVSQYSFDNNQIGLEWKTTF
ncbi:MAG: outer membrane beta-barrel protein [Verrucomicrobiota bacterium]